MKQKNGLVDFKSRKNLCKTSIMDIGPPLHEKNVKKIVKGMICPYCSHRINTFAVTNDYYIICPFCRTML